MSFKFTLDREGKIKKIVSKIIRSGAGIVSERFTKIKDDEEKADRVLESDLRREAVKILHNRKREKIAKESRRAEIRKKIYSKRKKARKIIRGR